MRLANRILGSLLAVVTVMCWAGCGGGCPTTSLSSSSSSGGPSAGKSVGGSVCGPGTTPPPSGGNTAAFLYYEGTNDILGASLGTTGTFAAISPFTPPTLPSSAGSDMLIVNKKFLYLPQSDSLTIQAFAIDRTTGALSAISGSPFATFGADSITSDPTGRFLFAGNGTTGQISVFQINATTGALTATSGSPFSAFNLNFVHVLAVDGTGKFLYAGQGSAFLPVYGFSIDQNSGALAPIVGSPFGLNVAVVRKDFTGKYAIGLSGVTGDKSLYVFGIDQTTGALASVTGSPFTTVATSCST
jgi:6-phosphogluconolactonase